MTTPRIHALIPAAGLSVRFGGTTLKQYAHLLGKPVISHSIEAVKHHPAVSGVTVALSADDGIYDSLVRPSFPDVGTTVGGQSRAQTVMNGLKHILTMDPLAHWVLVHDAARPCLEAELLTALVRACSDNSDGAILAVPVSDTVKKAGDDERIKRTVNRDGLWCAQTPQLFPLRKLAHALEEALSEEIPPTDEASAMEYRGASPRLVMGSHFNIKITGPEDLALAESILRFRKGHEQDGQHHAYTDRPGV